MTPSLVEASERALSAALVARREVFLAPLHAQLYHASAVHFERQRTALETALRARGATLNEAVCYEGLLGSIDGILAPIFYDYHIQFRDAMVPPLREAMIGAVKHRDGDLLPKEITRSGIGLSFDLRNPDAVDYLKRYCGQQVTKIDETTRRAMRGVIIQGTDEGVNYSEIGRRMIAKYRSFGEPVPQRHLRNRAELIATYEIGSAYETASAQAVTALAALGLPVEKSWLTVGDDRVEEHCLANEAEGWIPLSQAHTTGHMHPLGHPACRCGELYRLARATMPAPKSYVRATVRPLPAANP